MKKIIILLIKLYQKIISPIFGRKCRFYPSCSNYAIEAIDRHGIFYGSWLSFKRLVSCHPFNDGGYDPVKK